MRRPYAILLLVPLSWTLAAAAPQTSKRPLTVQDIMAFRAIHSPRISADGQWVAYEARPDRGDGQGAVVSSGGEARFEIDRGRQPLFSKDSRWVVFRVALPFSEEDKEKDKDKEERKPGLALLDTRDGGVLQVESVQRLAFSDDSRWLAYHLHPEEPPQKEGEKGSASKDDKTKRKPGTTLVLRNLPQQEESRLERVSEFALDPQSSYLAYSVTDEEGKGIGLFLRDLSGSEEAGDREIAQPGHFSQLTWSRRESRLAFLAAEESEKGEPRAAALWLWDRDAGARRIEAESAFPQSWEIPSTNELSWSRDGQRLFFGARPGRLLDSNGGEAGEGEAIDPDDIQRLLGKREVDVWHWNDPLINSNQKKNWARVKDQSFTAVHHLDSGATVALADEAADRLVRPESPERGLLLADTPYQKEVTWEGRFSDAYLVDLRSGERTLAARRLDSPPSLSPGGRYLAYYSNQAWHLVDAATQASVDLTGALEVAFANEDHDYPSPRPSYGLAGWVEDDAALLIYDKYDVWRFATDGSPPLCLTGGLGRRTETTYRVVLADPESDFFAHGADLLLTSYQERKKAFGFYRTNVERVALKQLLEEDRKFDWVAKAQAADRVLYTRESYTEFPDLWVADLTFQAARKLTLVNPQIQDFAWGEAELVEWSSLDGTPLQGVLIRPGNHQPGRRYPVLVYFYRFFSQRLHEFNPMLVNHRPNFPFYASNGYAVFLPDIRFEVGRPGFSATKCLVPGVQKLIDLGIADPKAVGLHGHSWSGYQTAFVITQTDIFAAAVAGAPVSNMTSAYGGIRWETGLARQFQYEQSQSRIGGSLWESPHLYLENSPLFYADRINTPLLIQHGDEDGAVPWYQSIELYLAMRRLGKPCIFLQYRGEPHHLQKYPNKLDYTIKMKEFFDHHLKGAPAPAWMTEGVPYKGK